MSGLADLDCDCAKPTRCPHRCTIRFVLVVQSPDRYAVTTEIAARDGRVLLFLDTKHAVDQLTRHQRAGGVRAGALHSGKSQPQRTRTLAQFKITGAKAPSGTPLDRGPALPLNALDREWDARRNGAA